MFQVSLIKEETGATNVFDKIKNYIRPENIIEEPKANSTKNIELPPIVTASDLIQAQMNNKGPEPKIKRGIKRDHLTQQSMNSFVIPSTNLPTLENEECVTKKPKIVNTDSDMEISSDDEVQIIEDTHIEDSKNNLLPQIEELHPLEKKHDVSNIECKFQEPFYYQTTSANTQFPKIVMASNLLKNNYKPNSSKPDSSKDSINPESVGINNMLPSHHNRTTPHTFNKTCVNNMNNVKNQENGLLHSQSKNNKSQLSEKNVNDIFNELAELLKSSPVNGKKVTKSNEPASIQKNLKRPSLDQRLSTQHNIEVSSSKINMNSLFGDDSDDESKIMIDVKKKSLGVRLGMSSNVNNTFKISKKAHESTKTIRNKTEDPNNKQKKFELSNLVVNLLNPYYKNNVFKTKELFKFMAREIVHKLLESTSHPGKFYYYKPIQNIFLMCQ